MKRNRINVHAKERYAVMPSVIGRVFEINHLQINHNLKKGLEPP